MAIVGNLIYFWGIVLLGFRLAVSMFRRIELKRFFKPGLYHRVYPPNLKLHLRINPDRTGVLTINASRVIYLNETATAHVKLIMDNVDVDEAAKWFSRHYKVSREKAKEDHLNILNIINTLASEVEVCPFTYLGFKRIDPFQLELSAPLRFDLALTYKCNNNCIHCYSSSPRKIEELNTGKWKKILGKIWSLGVPQVLFTGGEPTLRNDLLDLVYEGERIGLVTGLVTNARLISREKAGDLERAGLDYVQVTLESCDEKVHDRITGVEGSWRETVEGLKNVLATSIYTSVNITITKINSHTVLDTVRFLADLGVENISCNSIIYAGRGAEVFREIGLPVEDVKDILVRVKELAGELGLNFIWYTPTRYCELNPLELELGLKACSAARITMAIEPNGNVIPCQSYFESLGNILRDDWNSIWMHPLALEIRSRAYLPEECRSCKLVNECGGGCPLELKGLRTEFHLCLEDSF